MSSTREIVEDAYAMVGFEWKPLYPNNMPCNGQEGYYAVKLHELDEDGVLSGRKYTILYQRESEGGCIKPDAKIEYYILFEKSYYEIVGRKEHPEPSDECDIMEELEDGSTLRSIELNDYGSFSWVCKTLDEAKEMALQRYQSVFGYAMSFLIEDE